MFCPKHSHELALKRIGRYLKNTSSHGLVINPTRELTIDAYPDSDFAGMYGHEKPTDSACAKSRSGFVIVCTGVPVLWQSKLQTQTALSTMEAEVIALGACMRELITIMDMVQLLAVAVGIPAGDVSMRVLVHETIWVHWCWLKLCHHNSRRVVSIMQPRLSGFVRRLTSVESNF